MRPDRWARRKATEAAGDVRDEWGGPGCYRSDRGGSAGRHAGRNRNGVGWTTLTSRTELFEIRREVYIVEQAVPPELEVDEHDPACVHVLARDPAGRPIGTGRLLDDGHVGRVAVVAPWRKHGVGAAVVRRLIDLARERAMPEVVADAQVRAIGFYERLGGSAEGAEFLDAGIPHRRMRLRVRR